MRWLRRRVIAQLTAMAAIFVCGVGQAHAQSLSVSGSLANVTPTVANFQANGNTGQSVTSGSYTLNLTNCKKNGTCVIKVSATGVPLTGALQWAVTAIGSGDNNISCVAATAPTVRTTLTTIPVTAVNCTLGNGSNNQNWSNIVITFSYPISWSGTPFGTYNTTGVAFRLEATG